MGSFLRIMRSFFSTGMYVILNYVFFVLKGFIGLIKKSIFVCAVINKRRHRPYMVPGKEMEDHFGEVDVGDTDAINITIDDFISN